MPKIITKREIDMDGVLFLHEMVVLLRMSRETILRRLDDGTFPIPPLDGSVGGERLRWWGPHVKRWIDANKLDYPKGERSVAQEARP